MKKLASIFIIALALSFGVQHILLTFGRHFAHSHAMKVAGYLSDYDHKLYHKTISLSDYNDIEFEYVGSGVFEFEADGKMFDVFEVNLTETQAVLLVKEDRFEGSVINIQKLFKRQLRTTSERVKAQLFNFYFFQSQSRIYIPNAVAKLHFIFDSITPVLLDLLVDSPPPEL